MKSEKLKLYSQDEFKMKDVTKIIGMDARIVQFYSTMKSWYELTTNVGRGKAVKYKRHHIITLSLIKELSRYGISIKTIDEVVFGFYTHMHQWWDKEKNQFKCQNYLVTVELGEDRFGLGFSPDCKHASLPAPHRESGLVIDVGKLVQRL
jgi:hypothetical protein